LLLTLHASHAYQAISPGPQSRSGKGSSTGLAFEMALVTLKQRREIDPLRDAVARKIIELAETGERDPERLCDAALKASDGHCPEVGGYGCLRKENATSE
jgi:hypothetical protein